MNVRVDQVLFVVLWALFTPVWAYYIRQYYLARHKKLIAVRIPYVSIFASTAMTLLYSFVVTQFFWLAPCAVVGFVFGVFVSTICGAIVVEHWALWFLHKITRDSMYRHSQMLERLKEKLALARSASGLGGGRKSKNDSTRASVSRKLSPKRALVFDYSWFLQHKHWVSTKFLVRLFVADSLLIPVAWAVTVATYPDQWSQTLLTCEGLDAYTVFGFAMIFLHSLLVIALAYAIRNHADGYCIKSDQKMKFVAFLFTGVPLAITIALFGDWEADNFYFSTLFIFFFALAQFYLTIVRVLRRTRDPLWQSKSLTSTVPNLSDVSKEAPDGQREITYTEGGTQSGQSAVDLEQLEEQRRANGLPDMRSFLAFPEFHESFKEFLKTEFAVENLLFHEQVLKFRSVIDQCRTGDTLLIADTSFLCLFDQFIVVDAPLEINVSARERKTVAEFARTVRERRERLEALPKEEALEFEESFDMDSYVAELRAIVHPPHNTIIRLMHVGPFPRYLTTQRFEDARTRIKIRVNELELGLASPKSRVLKAPVASYSALAVAEPSRAPSCSEFDIHES